MNRLLHPSLFMSYAMSTVYITSEQTEQIVRRKNRKDCENISRYIIFILNRYIDKTSLKYCNYTIKYL